MLEEQKYRYQIALSDLAGRDIEKHDGKYVTAIRKVRNWITTLGVPKQIGPDKVSGEYEDFLGWHYKGLNAAGFSPEDNKDYPTKELIDAMTEWVSRSCPRS